MTRMTAHVTRVESSSRIAGEETWRLAAAEYRRMLELLRTLGDGDWTRPTDCTAWDVRGMLGHLVGAVEGFGNPAELFHQYRVGAKLRRRGAVDGHLPVDGANAVQVSERASASTVELIARYERATPEALRWRRRLRWIPVSQPDDGGRFTMRELFEVILTRDTWMHRVDIARATGREMVLTPEHDGRLAEDCVLDWAKKHGRPFSLVLGGPAGGRFERGAGGPDIEIDAVEFVRALSGRGVRGEILGTRVVF
ncbi:MAG TPA: maleylpyruvate isomerase family mycothiol-dependent enzyme [Candidatus Limnocylindrales bacterium]